jgi:NADH:ubiquinone oxidoreductase subunit K
MLMNKEYLLIAAACAALAVAAVAEDVAAAIMVIFGSAIYWKNHKIEAKLNRLLARQRRRESIEASKLT